MKKLLLAACLAALVAAAPANAKDLLGVQLCGASGCVTDRDSALVEGPGGPLSSSGSVATPAEAGPWFRARLLLGDHGTVYGKLSFFYVPDGDLIVQPGQGAQPTTWSHPESRLSAVLKGLAAKVRPLPVPALTEVAVNGRPVGDPDSYLALYTAGHEPTTYPTELASVQITYQSDSPSPWTTGNSLVLYPKSHLLVRDGQIVEISAALADRAARGASLDLGGGFPWLVALAAALAGLLLAGLAWRFRPRPAPQPVAQA